MKHDLFPASAVSSEPFTPEMAAVARFESRIDSYADRLLRTASHFAAANGVEDAVVRAAGLSDEIENTASAIAEILEGLRGLRNVATRIGRSDLVAKIEQIYVKANAVCGMLLRSKSPDNMRELWRQTTSGRTSAPA